MFYGSVSYFKEYCVASVYGGNPPHTGIFLNIWWACVEVRDRIAEYQAIIKLKE
jgi:hypothetical protein